MKKIVIVFTLLIMFLCMTSCDNSVKQNNNNTTNPTSSNVDKEDNEVQASAEITKPTIVGNRALQYGYYPKTVITDEKLISKLDSISTKNNYGYYVYNGYKYSKYDGVEYVSNSGQKISKGIHYYQVEVIDWYIVIGVETDYTVVTKNIIDCQLWNSSKVNSYKNSSIRNWLNNDFYNVSFYNDYSSIQITNVDNSYQSCENPGVNKSKYNKFACENTEDKVWLPSVAERSSWSLGNAIPTDYARARGAAYMNEKSNGTGYWFLRSPYYEWNVTGENKSETGEYVYVSTMQAGLGGFYATVTGVGVRPGLKLTVQ